MADTTDGPRPESTQSGRQSRGGENQSCSRQADFFKLLDGTLLLSRGRGKKGAVELPQEILFLDLSQQQLIDISQVSLCLHLKICVLHSNFISNISPLSSAPNLSLIDASSNRIKEIPDREFWAGFPFLEILYLHDNPISSMECFNMLSSASKLRVVTLYDTPLSMNNTYRHIAVNSLWRLEGMDFYLLSDEEVIQDMDLYDTPFAAMSESYFLQLYQPLNPNWNFLTAEKHMSDFLHLINRKLAKLSPVLVIQRYVRGWLVRKNIPFHMQTQLSTTRRKLDEWFQPLSHSANLPIFRDSSYWFMLKALQAPPPTADSTYLAPLLEQTTIDFAKLATSINRKLHNQSIRKFSHGSRTEQSYSTITSHSYDTDFIAKRYTRSYGMFLHLQKMRRKSWKLLNDAPPTFGHLYRVSRTHKRKRLRKLSQGSLNRSTLSLTSEPESDDVTRIMFRDQSLLVSKQEPIKPLDLYKEMLFSKRDTGIEIRDAEEKIHEVQRFYSKSNVPKIHKKATKHEIPSPPPMNIRQLEGIMKRASQSKKRRNEMQGKSNHIREMKEDGMLKKLGAEMIRDKSRDRLSRMGRSECEENRDILERLKLEDMEINRQRVKEFREKERQAKDKQSKLMEASLNASNARETSLLLSDKVNAKSSKDFIKKRSRVEKMKEGERQAIQKILQKSIDKTRRIQASRLAEREQMNEEIIKADKTRDSHNKRRIQEIKSPNENERFWTREGITPSYHLPKAGSISPIFGRTSVHMKSAAQINLIANHQK